MNNVIDARQTINAAIDAIKTAHEDVGRYYDYNNALSHMLEAVNLLESIEYAESLEPQWISVEEFKEQFRKGLIDTSECWCVFNGRVTWARYEDGFIICGAYYYFDGITAVMPITKPQPPIEGK